MNDHFPIVVHGRFPWASPWRRPKQTHSRLGPRHPILYLEPACRLAGPRPDRIRLRKEPQNVRIVEPQLAGEARGPEDDSARISALLRDSSAFERLGRAVHWVYGPIPDGRLELFPEPLAIVYDCLEEPGSRGDPPDEGAGGEEALLRAADLVFTAGHELCRARLPLRPDARFVPSGVDFAHFHSAVRATPPSDLARIPPPRIGYSGVVDARIDLDALARLAAARPHDSIVLLGPVEGLDPERLPRARNLFYLGERPYRRLPEYFSGFSAGVMPFRSDTPAALANPEAPLEWLSAGKPVVATPLADLVRFFSETVTLAEPADLGEAIDRALARDLLAVRRGEEIGHASPWAPMASEMELLVARVVQRRRQPPSHPPTAAAV
jgi:UDP-galactopyranose mutase